MWLKNMKFVKWGFISFSSRMQTISSWPTYASKWKTMPMFFRHYVSMTIFFFNKYWIFFTCPQFVAIWSIMFWIIPQVDQMFWLVEESLEKYTPHISKNSVISKKIFMLLTWICCDCFPRYFRRSTLSR